MQIALYSKNGIPSFFRILLHPGSLCKNISLLENLTLFMIQVLAKSLYVIFLFARLYVGQKIFDDIRAPRA